MLVETSSDQSFFEGLGTGQKDEKTLILQPI